MERNDPGEALNRLWHIMATLRSPQGCPWDAAQTPESLQPYLLEETYEVLQALDSGDMAAICDELGDLLLQIVFLARIFNEREAFGMADVAHAISDKLVRRHPHVFGDAPTGDMEALHDQWERIKRSEKENKPENHSFFASIPHQMPALVRAAKIAEKAARLERGSLDVPDRNSLGTQLEHLIAAAESGDRNSAEEKLGEMLQGMAALGRSLDLDPEQALRRTLERTIESLEGIQGDRK